MSSSVSPKSKPRRGSRLRRVVVLSVIILGGLLLFAIIRSQGRVSGEEFAPSHFHVRHFEFYELPGLQLQISPIRRTGTTFALTSFLRNNGYLPRPMAAPKDDGWHLIKISRGPSGSSLGDAQLLTTPLAMEDRNGLVWQTWSESNPAEAKFLWPLVQRLATRELYVLLPEILELASHTSSRGQDFSNELNRTLEAEYASLIQDMRDAGRPELASGLLKEALQDYPESQSLQQLSQEKTSANSSAP